MFKFMDFRKQIAPVIGKPPPVSGMPELGRKDGPHLHPLANKKVPHLFSYFVWKTDSSCLMLCCFSEVVGIDPVPSY